MIRAAILGCKGRSRGHMNAYQHISRGRVIAICDMDADLLHAFGNQFGIERRYTDLVEMLEKERPDVLHIVTRPSLRVPLMTLVAEHRVPGVIVEKPIALDSTDFRQLQALAQQSETKFAVNHQLHFHPKRLELEEDVRSGRIGEVRFIETSARLGLTGQGTHILEMLFSFNGFVAPTSVFGQVAGKAGLNTTHPAPDMAEAVITFENGVRALLLCGKNAPAVAPDAPEHQHKRIAVYGTRGFVEWQMNAWERNTPEGYESAQKSYGKEDVLGQAGLTEAMFDWLEDEEKPHPTRLERALQQFNVILGLYASVLEHRPVPLPYAPEYDFLERLAESI